MPSLQPRVPTDNYRLALHSLFQNSHSLVLALHGLCSHTSFLVFFLSPEGLGGEQNLNPFLASCLTYMREGVEQTGPLLRSFIPEIVPANLKVADLHSHHESREW